MNRYLCHDISFFLITQYYEYTKFPYAMRFTGLMFTGKGNVSADCE